jgi:hypothetical protein
MNQSSIDGRERTSARAILTNQSQYMETNFGHRVLWSVLEVFIDRANQTGERRWTAMVDLRAVCRPPRSNFKGHLETWACCAISGSYVRYE